MSVTYAGIDNGLDGGIVAVHYPDIVARHDGGDVSVPPSVVLFEKAPVEEYQSGRKTRRRLAVPGLVQIVKRLAELGAIVVLEEAQAMPGQGSVSMFTTGLGRGLWEGALAMAGVRYETVHPRTWQATLFKGLPGTDPKARSIQYAQRMFPMQSFVLPRCRVPHDGLCDAACMVAYARAKYGIG